MPATLSENQRRILVSMGYNPDEAQDSSIEEFYGQQQPTLSNELQAGSIKAKPSAGGVLVRQAGTSVAPTAAGFAVGGQVTAATAPFLGPWSVVPGLLAGVTTGLVANYAQKKAIEKLAPQFAQQLETDVQERPIVSAVGNLIGSGVVAKPDPRAIVGAIKGIRALTTGAKVAQADAKNLVNVGIGAGVPAVQETVGAIRNKEVNPTTALINIVGGALLNNPTRLGKMLGGTPNTYSNPDIAVSAKPKGPLVEHAPLPESTRTSAADVGLDDLYSKALDSKMNPDILAKSPELTPEIARAASIPELRSKDPVVEANEETIAEKKRVGTLSKAQAKADAEAEAVAAQLNKPDATKLQYEQELLDAELQNLPEKQLPAGQKIPLKKETPTLKQKQEYGNQMRTALEQTPEQIMQGMKDKGISRTPNQAWHEAMTKLGEARDVKIDLDGNLVSENTGKPIAGQAFLRDSLGKAMAKVNPKLAGVDTWPHELTHIFIDDLANGPSKLGQKLVKDGEAIVTQSKEFADAKSANPDLTPHEFMTQGVGEDTVRRLLSTDNKGKFSNWLSDFWSFAKTKFGKGTTEDYKRLLSNKLLIDAPANELAMFNDVKPMSERSMRRINKEAGLEEQPESSLNEANVSFKGIQPGFGEFKRFPLYNIEGKNLSDNMIVGSTVSRESLEKAGFSIPKGELTKEAVAELREISDYTREDFDRMYKENNYTKHAIELGTIIKETPVLAEQLNALKEAALQKQQKAIVDGDIDKMLLEGDKAQFFSEVHGAATDTRSGGETAKIVEAQRQFEQTESSLGPEVAESDANRPADISLPVMRSAIESVARIDAPEAPILAKKFTEFYQKLTDNRGEYVNGLIRPLKDVLGLRFDGSNFKTYLTQNNESANKVLSYLKESTETGSSSIPLNTQEQKAVRLIRDSIETVNLQRSTRGGITKLEPPDWSEGTLLDVMSQYLDKVSRRFAYHDALQNPEAEKALEPLASNNYVQGVMRDIKGMKTKGEAFRSSLGSFVRSLMLGPLTGVRDYSNNITIGMQHMDGGQVLKSYLDATVNLPKNLAESFKAGVNRENINSLEFGDEGLGKMTEFLRRGRDIVADVQGRNWLEQITRATAYGQGKSIGLDNMYQYSKGKLSKQGERFLDEFHPNKNWRANKSGEISPENLQQIAARYTESVQGSYDLRGLPLFVTEGSLSQALALAKWNVEKGNNFFKHVVTPAANGDYRPLLMQTLGMFAQGLAVTKLTELITKRKDKHADISELEQASSKDKPVTSELLYKTLGLVAASGYAGIVGETAHSAMDLLYGKNKPQSYHNALSELASNLIDSISSVKYAIDEGAGPEIVIDALGKAIEDNVQIARLAASYLNPDKIKKIDRGNKLRDLRTFNRLYDKPIPDLSDFSSDKELVNKDVKTFKRTDNVNEAAALLPELIKKAVVDAKGDPDRLRSNLANLKRNSYQTMPSPETFPQSFLEYMTFLKETQGEDAARDRLMDFLRQREVNKMKNDLVPSGGTGSNSEELKGGSSSIVSNGLLDAIAQVESNGNAKAVNKKTGAKGMFQFMPIGWKDVRQQNKELSKYEFTDENAFNPEIARKFARQLLETNAKRLGKDATLEQILASYNWGYGNVSKKGIENMPKETADYIAKIQKILTEKKGQNKKQNNA